MTEQKLAEFINEHLSDVNKQRTKSGFKAFVSKVLKVFGFKADKRHQNYKALTRVLLRTDMSSLLNRLGFEELVSLLGDTDKRQRQITKLEQRIAKQTSGIDMVRQTKRLGWYLATKQTVEHLVKNAKAIASRTGLPNSIDINQADANLVLQSLLLHYGLDLPTVVEPAWLLNIDPIPVDGSLLIAPNALMDITPIDLATRVL